MVLIESTGHTRIIRDRKFEDYRSLKQYFRNHNIEEIIFNGSDLSAGEAAEFNPAGDLTVAYLGAEAQVYVKSQADLEALDGDSIYITYLDNAGVLNVTETLLDEATGTDEEMPLGNENVKDAVSAVDAFEVTLTATAATENQFAGKYMVVYSGDQKGTNSLIVSNTAHETTPILTVADTQNANLAADLISIQTKPYDDFIRLRSMSCETKAPTDNAIVLCNHDGTALYGVINDANAQAAPVRYFVPAITTGQNSKYYLGYIKARCVQIQEAAAGYFVEVRYTPKQTDSNVPTVQIVQHLEFNEFLDWQPCIELEPATDVQFYIGDNATPGIIHLEYAILEVDRLSN